MTGPVIGGVLMSTMGAGYAFAVNALTFVAPDRGALADARHPAAPSTPVPQRHCR